jgi:hypothetical protein
MLHTCGMTGEGGVTERRQPFRNFRKPTLERRVGSSSSRTSRAGPRCRGRGRRCGFLRNSGKTRLNGLRDQIKALAASLAMEQASADLDGIIGTLLGPRARPSYITGRKARGTSFDQDGSNSTKRFTMR